MDRELSEETLKNVKGGVPGFKYPEPETGELSLEEMETVIAGLNNRDVAVDNALANPDPYRQEALDRLVEEVIAREEAMQEEPVVARSR